VTDIIRRLVECHGPSGSEAAVRDLIRAEVESSGVLKRKGCQASVDALGNLAVLRKGSGGGRRVMLAAHMDEIGIVVSHVDEKGFLRFSNIGGVRPLNLTGSRVRFADGTAGVIGLERLEEPSKLPGLDRFYLDIGAADKESVRMKVGDTASFFRPFEEVGGRLVSKAMDDRIGCAVLLQVLRELESSPHDVHVVFTVQEEVGLRGATTSGFGVDPELAIAVDVTGTGDTPECFPMAMYLGKGPAIKVRDGGMLAHAGVKDWLVRTAEGAGIPYQLEVLEGGTTDAKAIQTSRAGVPTGCVSVPTRYIHTPSEMVDPGDVRNAVRLLVAALSAPISIG
jgi:putative aminopeptidase FrvX